MTLAFAPPQALVASPLAVDKDLTFTSEELQGITDAPAINKCQGVSQGVAQVAGHLEFLGRFKVVSTDSQL